MKVTRIWQVFFSPTGNTRKAVTYLAEELDKKLHCPIEEYDLSLIHISLNICQWLNDIFIVKRVPVQKRCE